MVKSHVVFIAFICFVGCSQSSGGPVDAAVGQDAGRIADLTHNASMDGTVDQSISPDSGTPMDALMPVDQSDSAVPADATTPADQTMVFSPDLTIPPDLSLADLAPSQCMPMFLRAIAIETASSRLLPPRGGIEDAKSVVTLIATVAPTGFKGILYAQWDTAFNDCTRAVFPNSIKMSDVGAGQGGEDYTGVIMAYKAGTHVCWRLQTTVCGTTFTDPPAAPSYDYTTM